MVASFDKTAKTSRFGNIPVNVKQIVTVEAVSSLDDWGEVETGISYKAGAEIPAQKQPTTVLETKKPLTNTLGISKKFDIRDHLANLTPSHKGKNYYICPGCSGNSLHINPDTGAYKCWSNECDSALIREAVAPTGKPIRKANKPAAKPATPKPRMKPVVAPVGLLPQPTPVTPGEYKGKQYQIKYPYSVDQFVMRYEYQKNGKREKTFTPHHIDSNGVAVAKKGDKLWPLYRMPDIEKYSGGCWINEAEGEKGADHLASIGLIGFSTTGTANEADIRYGYQEAINAGIVGIIYHQDNDTAGENKAKKHKKIADEMGIPFIVIPAKELDPDIKEAGDIADLISEGKVTKDSLISFLDNKIKEAVNKPDDQPLLNNVVDITTGRPSNDLKFNPEDPEINFNQIAFKALFNDSYICVNEKFYQWQGTHYKELDNTLELKRIRDFCNTYMVVKEDKEGNIKVTYPFANTKSINELFKWAQVSLAVSQEAFTKTTGINCKNGVLTIDWDGKKPIAKLEPHDPQKHYFTTEPIITYDPKADTKYADQLLKCLDAKQLQVLLRNLGAALDIPAVRKFKGRLLKILFCIGQGSNGKDSIREVVSLIFGSSAVTNFSLNDFTDYDNGNKNSLAGLSKARVNWASESGKTTRIDNSLSLKRFATGDTLTERYLFKDGVDYVPSAIALFNLNEMPNLFGTGQAALDRFAPLIFSKTFVKQEDYDPTNPNHELADSRFKYDREFLIKEVCPAFLNYMTQALEDLMVEGIDYSCTEQALDQIQTENNHLFDFINEMGWKQDPNAQPIQIGTLYQYLENWYIAQEILDIGDFDKRIWQEPIKPSDKYVKGANQLFPRLKEIFPNIEKIQKTPLGHPKKVPHITGLSILLDKPKQPTIPTQPTAYIPTPTPITTEPTPTPTPTPTPVESASNIDTAIVLPPTPTPPTPVLSKSFEKNSKEELDPSFSAKTSQTIPPTDPKNSADGDGTVENKGSLGQTGVTGVDHTPQNLTTQGLQPNQTGVGFGVGAGVETGVCSTDVHPAPTVETQKSDRTPTTTPTADIDDLISRIKVEEDPQEIKKQQFKQQLLEEQKIIEDIKSDVLSCKTAKEHQDLKETLVVFDGKTFRAIKTWLQNSITTNEAGIKEFTILPQEFVEVWLN